MLSLIARSPPSSTRCGSRLVGSEPSAIVISAPSHRRRRVGRRRAPPVRRLAGHRAWSRRPRRRAPPTEISQVVHCERIGSPSVITIERADEWRCPPRVPRSHRRRVSQRRVNTVYSEHHGPSIGQQRRRLSRRRHHGRGRAMSRSATPWSTSSVRRSSAATTPRRAPRRGGDRGPLRRVAQPDPRGVAGAVDRGLRRPRAPARRPCRVDRRRARRGSCSRFAARSRVSSPASPRSAARRHDVDRLRAVVAAGARPPTPPTRTRSRAQHRVPRRSSPRPPATRCWARRWNTLRHHRLDLLDSASASGPRGRGTSTRRSSTPSPPATSTTA